jgi:hypothetical protein
MIVIGGNHRQMRDYPESRKELTGLTLFSNAKHGAHGRNVLR